jgi:hypothetical protein
VDLRGGKVTVTQPSLVEAAARGEGLQPSFALLGRNEIDATVSNLTRSAVGAFTPSRVRVRFDLGLTNKLLNADLVPGTFPAPPIGVAQVIAFPFATNPAGLFGLKVIASTDWNGTGASGSGGLHNFFNDAICIALTPPGDCFRWEAFGPTLGAGGTTTRGVGFDVDPSVSSFTVYLVVAADIAERPQAPGLGGIAGVVRSPQLGPLSGIIVRAGEAGSIATTDAAGFYVFSGFTPGPVTLIVDGVYPGCVPPSELTANVTAGGVAAVNFSVSCPPEQEGTVRGTVTSALYGAMQGVVVSISRAATTDGNGGTVTTDANGRYVFTRLPTNADLRITVRAPLGCMTPELGFINLPRTGSTRDISLRCEGSAHPGSIRFARYFAAPGANVVVSGVVTAQFPDGAPGEFKTYIQDATGGIAVSPTTALEVGTTVNVNGVRSSPVSGLSRDEAQIMGAGLIITGAVTPVVPRLIGASEILDGSAVGELVQMVDLLVDLFEYAPGSGFLRVSILGGGSFATFLVHVPEGFSSDESLVGETFVSVVGVLAHELGSTTLRPRSALEIDF